MPSRMKPARIRNPHGWRIACGLALATSLAVGPSALGQSPPIPEGDEEINRAVERALAESGGERPEWVEMLEDIRRGSQLGPEDGWFRTAVAQTRFGWEATRQRYDGDGDGRIGRGEFPGNDADFARIDRDRDGSLSPADFDFGAHALTPSLGSMVFARADRNGDGKVGRDEFDALFREADSGSQGFLSLGDLQEAFRPPPRPPTAGPAPGPPTRETLIRGLFRQEIGSLRPGPKLDEAAPDFTLKTIDGAEDVTLSKLIGPKPVVLVFGNVTCGPFRNQAGNIEKLYRLYKDRATFLMVYVREAHPTDGWRMESNDRVDVTLAQPRTYEERVGVARACGARLNLGFPMLVDTIDDSVGAPYSGMPSRLYLIDRQGKIAYKSGRGPFGFKPAELEQSLILLDQPEATAEGPPRSR